MNGPESWGVMFAMAVAGGLVGSFCAAAWLERRRDRRSRHALDRRTRYAWGDGMQDCDLMPDPMPPHDPMTLLEPGRPWMGQQHLP